MGKKKPTTSSSSSSPSSSTIIATKVPTQQHAIRENLTKKLSQQKRNEINQLADYLLKLGFDATVTVNELWTQYIEIEANLQRLQAIESELKTKSHSGKNRLATIDRFYEWAISNGAHFDGVRIKQFPHYELGLVATKDFQRGEIFAKIPKKLILSLDNLSEVASEILDQIPVLDTMPNVRLAFVLVIERLNGGASFFKPYIDLLPERYSTVMYFTPVEMNELKGTSAFVTALNHCKNISRQYAFIRKAIQSLKSDRSDSMLAILKSRFTYDLYCWAVSTVMTRQNSIPSEMNNNNTDAKSDAQNSKGENDAGTKEESAETPALIPLWDVANHSDGIVTTSYNITDAQIVGATLNDVKKDEQIFIHYGNRNNANLLVHNGFVVENNQWDSVVIRLGLSQQDPLFRQRTQLLESIGITKNSEITVLPAPKFISPELLAFVRIFNMNEEQLKHWLAPEKVGSDLLYLDCALETALEIKTWNFLKMRLTLLLKAFPTNLEDDVKLLEQHQKKGQQKLGHIKTMIIHYRITEKRILRDALTYIEERSKA